MATHSSILAWRIPWTEVVYSPWGRKEADTTEHTGSLCITCSLCLEGPTLLPHTLSFCLPHKHLQNSGQVSFPQTTHPFLDYIPSFVICLIPDSS